MADNNLPENSTPLTIFKRPKRGKSSLRKEKKELNEFDDEESSKPNVIKPIRPSKWNSSSLMNKKKCDFETVEENETSIGTDKMSSRVSVDYHSEVHTKTEDLATKELEIDTPFDQDAQALFERNMKLNKEREGKKDDGIYRGQSGYTQYITKQDSIKGKASSNLVRQGPYRASSNIRVTTRWDYQPDICKDYKETGFCGFGDSCKFVHDRGDYKYGWELEQDYEAGLLAEQDKAKFEIDSNEEEEELPFTCPICKDPFTKPIKTKCLHYFCEKCALEHHNKVNQRCFVCGQNTFGIFNSAKEISSKLLENTDENKPDIMVNEGEIVNEIEPTSSHSSQEDTETSSD